MTLTVDLTPDQARLLVAVSGVLGPTYAREFLDDATLRAKLRAAALRALREDQKLERRLISFANSESGRVGA